MLRIDGNRKGKMEARNGCISLSTYMNNFKNKEYLFKCC